MKINRVDLVFNFVDRIAITFEVYEEISKCRNLILPLMKLMQSKKIEIIESHDFSKLKNKYSGLGSGELSIIASSSGKIAFIEDRKAERIAEKEGVAVFNLPELILACKKRKILDKKEISKIIKELKEKNGYILKNELEEELLK